MGSQQIYRQELVDWLDTKTVHLVELVLDRAFEEGGKHGAAEIALAEGVQQAIWDLGTALQRDIGTITVAYGAPYGKHPNPSPLFCELTEPAPAPPIELPVETADQWREFFRTHPQYGTSRELFAMIKGLVEELVQARSYGFKEAAERSHRQISAQLMGIAPSMKATPYPGNEY